MRRNQLVVRRRHELDGLVPAELVGGRGKSNAIGRVRPSLSAAELVGGRRVEPVRRGGGGHRGLVLVAVEMVVVRGRADGAVQVAGTRVDAVSAGRGQMGTGSCRRRVRRIDRVSARLTVSPDRQTTSKTPMLYHQLIIAIIFFAQ